MQIEAIRTRPLMPPKDDLIPVFKKVLKDVQDRSIIAISSKVVAIHEGRAVSIPKDVDPRAFKDELAKREADRYIDREDDPQGHRLHTMKHGILIGSAGIDVSNGDGYCILWPEDPMHSAHVFLEVIREIAEVKRIGVIITDSHSAPLRNGVTGIALGYAGFRPLFDYRKQPDIFGRPLRSERLNVADSLATAANLAMGEGNECTPIAVMRDIPHVVFGDTSTKDPYLTLSVSPEEDIFSIFFRSAPWKNIHDDKH